MKTLFPVNYSLINPSGVVAMTGRLSSTNTTIRIADIPAGIYLFVFGSGSRNSVHVIKK